MHKNCISKNFNWKSIIIFSCLFIFLILQYRNVFLYYDDFGYASLSYAYVEPNVNGTNFSLWQLNDYLLHHYFIWGGRIVSFFQEILLFKAGLPIIRFVHALTITLIFLVIYLICHKDISCHSFFLPLITCSLFGLISISVLSEGAFWFCASVLYIIPIFYAFLGIYLYSLSILNKTKHKLPIYLCSLILIFLSTFSMEQISIATLVTLVTLSCFIYIKNKDKKLLRYMVPAILISVLCFIVLIGAPGNHQRELFPLYKSYYSLPFLFRIKKSFDNIFISIFSTDNLTFNLFIIFIGLLVCTINHKKCSNKYLNIINDITIALSILLILRYIFNVPFSKFQFIQCTFYFAYLLFLFCSLSIFFLSSNNRTDVLIWCFLLGGYTSIACLIISPVFVCRNLLYFYFTFILSSVRVIFYVFEEFTITNNKKLKNIFTPILISIMVVSCLNMLDIYGGYRTNRQVLLFNQKAMTIAHSNYINGQKTNNVVIFHLKDPRYGIMEGKEVVIWMREYYGLPKDFGIKYEQYDEAAFRSAKAQQDKVNLSSNP